jgi:hypothetical protein
MLSGSRRLWRPSSAWHPMAPPLLSWLSKGLRQQTLSLQRSRPTFPEGNLPSVTMIKHGVPEVKLCHQQVQIMACPSMMHGGASLRTVPRGNTAMNGMTSTILLKTRGISGRTPSPPRRSLAEDVAPVGKVDSVFWRDHSDMFGDQTSSRLATSTGMMAPATLKNLFRCIRPSLRPPEETIGLRLIFYAQH